MVKHSRFVFDILLQYFSLLEVRWGVGGITGLGRGQPSYVPVLGKIFRHRELKDIEYFKTLICPSFKISSGVK